MDENILEELQDLKRLRTIELKEIRKYQEYLLLFKPMTKKDKLFAWLIPLLVFVGAFGGIIWFMMGMTYCFK